MIFLHPLFQIGLTPPPFSKNWDFFPNLEKLTFSGKRRNPLETFLLLLLFLEKLKLVSDFLQKKEKPGKTLKEALGKLEEIVSTKYKINVHMTYRKKKEVN